MNRYLVFSYDKYYPSGGWSDFASAFDNSTDAISRAMDLHATADYVEVVDTETLTAIYENQAT